MRVLTLLTHLDHPRWQAHTTSIEQVDPRWAQRSLRSKAWELTRLAPAYESILFYNDVRLPVLFWFVHCLRRAKPPSQRLFFPGLLCDVSRFNTHKVPRTCESARHFIWRWLYDTARWFYYCWFVRIHACIIVYSRAEVQLYADTFRVSTARFKFVPFYVRPDALSGEQLVRAVPPQPYILAAGRHRDFATFCAAMQQLALPGVVIAGADERATLQNNLPANVRAYYELSRAAYRNWIVNARVFVVPLYAARWTRSLGQIAAFEAVAAHVPVVAARTFQLADYFCADQEILFYEPEDAFDLQRQIERVLNDAALVTTLTTNAYARLVQEYTVERYADALLDVMDGG